MTDETKTRLANPARVALHSGQRHLAHALDGMRRYARDMAPLCAVPEDGMCVSAASLEWPTEDACFVGAIPMARDHDTRLASVTLLARRPILRSRGSCRGWSTKAQGRRGRSIRQPFSRGRQDH